MAKNKSLVWDSSKLIRDVAKQKLFNAKNDIQWIALVILEIFLILVLVGSIVVYLDGRYATIDFPFNLMLFAAITYIVFRIYSYTETFRDMKELKRKRSLKIFTYEFAIFLIVLFSIFLYQDPTINIIPYPFNFIVFIIALIIPVYLYIEEVYLKKK